MCGDNFRVCRLEFGLFFIQLIHLTLAEKLHHSSNSGGVNRVRQGDELQEVSSLHFTHGLCVTFDLSVEIASGFIVCENMCSAERHNVLLRSVHVSSVALRDRISCIAVLNENDNPVDSAIGSNDGFHNKAPSKADDRARKSGGLECCGHI